MVLTETYENTAHIDITYLLVVWFAFAPTALIPILYAVWMLSRPMKERLRGYFRLSSRSSCNKPHSADAAQPSETAEMSTTSISVTATHVNGTGNGATAATNLDQGVYVMTTARKSTAIAKSPTTRHNATAVTAESPSTSSSLFSLLQPKTSRARSGALRTAFARSTEVRPAALQQPQLDLRSEPALDDNNEHRKIQPTTLNNAEMKDVSNRNGPNYPNTSSVSLSNSHISKHRQAEHSGVHGSQYSFNPSIATSSSGSSNENTNTASTALTLMKTAAATKKPTARRSRGQVQPHARTSMQLQMLRRHPSSLAGGVDCSSGGDSEADYAQTSRCTSASTYTNDRDCDEDDDDDDADGRRRSSLLLATLSPLVADDDEDDDERLRHWNRYSKHKQQALRMQSDRKPRNVMTNYGGRHLVRSTSGAQGERSRLNASATG